MKRKISSDKVVTAIVLVIVGMVLTRVAIDLGGIELLLVGAMVTLLMEGAMTIMLPNKWCGFVYHLLWATAFYCYRPKDCSMFVGYQRNFLWLLLAVRILILQPIYLKVISRKSNF